MGHLILALRFVVNWTQCLAIITHPSKQFPCSTNWLKHQGILHLGDKKGGE